MLTAMKKYTNIILRCEKLRRWPLLILITNRDEFKFTNKKTSNM